MLRMEELDSLTQTQYDKLMSRLADVIHTQRQYIEILSAERVNSCVTRFKVKRKGEYYPYLIEENFTRVGNIYLNLGLVL